MINVGYGMTVLNACEAAGGVDGIGTYTKELKAQIECSSDEVKIHPFTVGLNKSAYRPASEKGVFQFGRFTTSALTSLATGLPFARSNNFSSKVDLVHATDHYIPNVGKLPLVATIMDAIPLSHPEWTSAKLRSVKNYLWVKTAHWADRVITISDFSKSEIHTHFHIPLERIDVVPLGVDKRWFQSVPDDLVLNVGVKYKLPASYFLFVGTIQPRKNIQRLINAHCSLPETIKSQIPLVIIGRDGWGCDGLVQALNTNQYSPTVIWLKHIPADDLLPLMKSALALVCPSLLEGFGLPVLEAFAAGVPVIASNTTSLPEVAGDAALLVDPLDEVSIASAMLNVAEKSELRESLILKGKERTQLFSWEETASKTVDVYKKVLG